MRFVSQVSVSMRFASRILILTLMWVVGTSCHDDHSLDPRSPTARQGEAKNREVIDWSRLPRNPVYADADYVLFSTAGVESRGFGVLVRNVEDGRPMQVLVKWKGKVGSTHDLLAGQLFDTRDFMADSVVLSVSVSLYAEDQSIGYVQYTLVGG